MTIVADRMASMTGITSAFSRKFPLTDGVQRPLQVAAVPNARRSSPSSRFQPAHRVPKKAANPLDLRRQETEGWALIAHASIPLSVGTMKTPLSAASAAVERR